MPTPYADLDPINQVDVESHLRAICALVGIDEGNIDGLLDALDLAIEMNE